MEKMTLQIFIDLTIQPNFIFNHDLKEEVVNALILS